MARRRSDGRQRGRIEQRGGSLRVVVFTGDDPVTGRRTYLRENIRGTDDAAWRKAENTLTQLRAKVLRQRSTASTVKFGYAVDEWLRTADIEQSTRDSYVGYINRVPVLGDIAVSKFGARQLENLYADLRRWRMRCDGKPFVEKRQAEASTTVPPRVVWRTSASRSRPRPCGRSTRSSGVR